MYECIFHNIDPNISILIDWYFMYMWHVFTFEYQQRQN